MRFAPLLLMPLLLAAGLLRGAAPAPAAPAAANGAVVLMYHRFGEDRYPSTSIRLEQFEAHLRELRAPAYTVLPVPEIVAALREGRPLPERTVGITVDDAYRSVYTVAWPRLRAAGMPFTVFVSTDAVDRRFAGMVTWDELREMVASGSVTLGNHTASHLHMADEGRTRNRDELQAAGRRIAEETGQAPTLLAYPYGEYSIAVRKLAEDEGFAAAFGQHSGVIARNADRFTLPRFALNEHFGTLERFRLAVNALPLPVRDVVPADMLLSPLHNPPLFGFTVAEEVGALVRLACYVSGQERLSLRPVGGRRLEGRPERPLPAGRSRINCTLPGPQGRWRWFGVQFYLPGS